MHGGLRLLSKHGMASSMFYEPNIILVLRFETTKVTNEALSGTRAMITKHWLACAQPVRRGHHIHSMPLDQSGLTHLA